MTAGHVHIVSKEAAIHMPLHQVAPALPKLGMAVDGCLPAMLLLLCQLLQSCLDTWMLNIEKHVCQLLRACAVATAVCNIDALNSVGMLHTAPECSIVMHIPVLLAAQL